MQTGVDSLVLLDVRELLERLVAVGTGVLAHVGVYERVLSQLLRRRKCLETLAALVSFLFHAVRLLGVTLHVRLVGKLLQPPRPRAVKTATDSNFLKPTQLFYPATVNFHLRYWPLILTYRLST